MRYLLIALLLLVPLAGCNNLSPRLDNEIDNQNGRIDDIKNNQNGIMLDLLKMKNQQEIIARDIGNLQQGLINKNNENYGVQILQGDGGLVLVFALGTIAMLLIFHYRTKYVKAEKVANLLADEIAAYDDIKLDNAVFMSAMNANLEEEIYHQMVNSQAKHGRLK